MSVLDNLKKQKLKKTFFIKVEYIDPTDSLVKKVYFSDSYIEIPENLISGTTLVPQERIEKVPNFSRIVDLIENDVVISSSYNISIFNQDNKWTTFFTDNFFTNQVVTMYVTTEKDINPFSYLKICTARITSTEIGSQIILKLDELQVYEKTDEDLFELYNYPNMDEGLKQEFKPIIGGKIKNRKVENINEITSSKFVDSKLLVSIVANTRNLKVLTATDSDAELLRYMIKQNDIVSFPGIPSKVGQEFKYYSTSGPSSTSGNPREFLFEGTSFTNESGYLYIKNDDNYLFNNKFLISKNKTKKRVSSEISNLINTSIFTCYITPTNNWDFIEIGDYIYIEHKVDTWKKERVYVESYDKVTNTIKILNERFSPLMTSFSDWTVNMDYVNSIKVSFGTPSRNLDIKLESDVFGVTVPIYSNIIQTDTKATLKIIFSNGTTPFFTWTSTRIGSAGNADTLSFVNDFYNGFWTENYVPVVNQITYAPIISSTSNKNGGNDIKIMYWYDGNSGVGTTLTQLAALSYPNMTLSTSGTIAGVLMRDYASTVYPMKGGYTAGTFFILPHAYGRTQAGERPFVNYDQGVAIWFDKGSSTIPPELSAWAGAIAKVTVLIGDTQSQIADKVLAAINSFHYQFNGLIAFKASPTSGILFVRNHYIHNAIKGVYTANTSVSQLKGSYRAFSTDIENTDELILNIDRVGLALQLQEIKKMYWLKLNKMIGTGSVNPYFNRMIIMDQPTQAEIDEPTSNWNQFSDDREVNLFDLYATTRGTVPTYVTSTQQQLKTAGMSYAIEKIYGSSDNYSQFILASNVSYKTDKYSIPSVIYDKGEIDTVYVNFKDEYISVADNLKNLMVNYGITDYSQSDLDKIKLDHPDFKSYFSISDNQEAYKQINNFNRDYNLVSYIDRDGIARFKFINFYDTTINQTLNSYDFFDFKLNSNDVLLSEINYKLIIDDFTDSYAENQRKTDAFLDSIYSLTKFKKAKDIETNLIENHFLKTFDGHTYIEHYSDKYFKKLLDIEFTAPIVHIGLDIFDNIQITNHPQIDENWIFKITEVQTDFNRIKFKATRLL